MSTLTLARYLVRFYWPQWWHEPFDGEIPLRKHGKDDTWALFEAGDAQALAEAIYAFVLRQIAYVNFNLELDLETRCGLIQNGSLGTFELVQL